jgi:hypothetical protein
VSRKKAAPRDPLMLEVMAAIGAGRILIGSIRGHEGEFVHGVCSSDGEIVINPAVDVTDTAIHECLHRLRPAWSERTVRRRTRRLMNQLSNDEVDKVFEVVMATATKLTK